MLNTIFGIVGWIGTLLVFAGLAIRMFRPQWDQYAYWAAVTGLVCVALPGRQAFERGPAFERIQLERRDALSAYPIEARGVLEHGCVAADTNVRENRTDGCLDRRVFLGVVRGQARQRRVEAWRGRVQSPG